MTLKAVKVSRERRGRVLATMVFVGAVSIPETEPLTTVNHRIGGTCSSGQGMTLPRIFGLRHLMAAEDRAISCFRSAPSLAKRLPFKPICPNSPAPTHQSACETFIDAPNQYSSACKAYVDALSHTCRGCNEVEGPRTINRIRMEVQAKSSSRLPKL